MRKTAFILMLSILFSWSCVPSRKNGILQRVDSLLVGEHYDSAYHEIISMDTLFENDEDRAHYQLLLVRTSYLTDNTLASDEVIDQAIDYYMRSGDMENLSESYYYKAACNHERGNKPEAMQFYKQAEEAGNQTHNLGLKYKIAESIAKINHQSGNNTLQLNYARKALALALESENRNWTAYSYFNLCKAFQDIGNIDSLSVYAKELIPRLGDIYAEDLPHFLSLIGFMYYKKGDYPQAKKYYEESLNHKEIALTLGNLADVYVMEGDVDKAYSLWKKAFLLEDGSRKDIILYDMLQYDLSHHQNLENVCERMYDLFTIRDSMTNAFKDRTLLELQQNYDDEVENHQHEKSVMKWMIAALLLFLLLLLTASYLKYKSYKARIALDQNQMQIMQYSNEIKQLETELHTSEEKANRYESLLQEYTNRIESIEKSDAGIESKLDIQGNQMADLKKENEALQKDIKYNNHKIEELKQKITDIVEKSSPMLNRGKLLYDSIMSGSTTSKWNKTDYECFVEYYKALNWGDYESAEKQYGKLTHHNALYVILNKMGKSNSEICDIMGINSNSLRSIKFRLQRKSGK